MAKLTVAGTTEVLIDSGLPKSLLPERAGRVRCALLAQPSVEDLVDDLVSSLEDEGLATFAITLPDRDEAKTLEVAQSVYESLARFGMSRDDTVVGVGGGAATDLAGFVAGTWLRGVEVVHVPTTLLGAVDASIGGKSGVNLAGKNLVGVFWHPTRVVIDLERLSNLPEPLVKEGMAEAYKAGLVGDPVLCRLMRDSGAAATLGEVVERAVAVKARIVGADERERGVRAYLNFGHTIGHALEYASALSHGESVALGMVAAGRISEETEGFGDLDEVKRTISGLGLPVRADGIDVSRVHELLSLDKKRDAGGLRMVLLAGIGDPVLKHVDANEIGLGLEAVGL